MTKKPDTRLSSLKSEELAAIAAKADPKTLESVEDEVVRRIDKFALKLRTRVFG
jgi:hypothetical protein